MKKVFLVFIVIFGFILTSSAQQHTAKSTKPTKTGTKIVLKKDGTPDKRYKKTESLKPVLKKDGTADKRYKGNK